jgi:hypothetical protein
MLFSLIIFIAIIYIIMNNRKKQSGTETYSDYDYPDMRGMGGRHNPIQGSITSQSGTSERAAATGSSTARGTSGTSARTAATGTSVARGASGTSTASKAGRTADKDAQAEKKPTSTMAYLDEKAKQDQKEHAMEKLQERKRTSEKYGNRPVGGRYLLGDPVPKGMKIVYCEYCGAENLVNIDYRNDRDCYFCRTHLED